MDRCPSGFHFPVRLDENVEVELQGWNDIIYGSTYGQRVWSATVRLAKAESNISSR